MRRHSSSYITIAQFNSRSLTRDRLTEFQHFLKEKNPHLVLLSETFWKPSFSPSFKSYSIVRKDRLETGGGGVAILIHKSIPFSQLATPSTDTLESIGINISSSPGPIDIISAYCPHGDANEEDISRLFDSTRHDCFIGGDFNGHHRLWKRGARTNTTGKSIAAALIERPDLLLLTPKDAKTRIDPCTGRPSTIDLSFASTSLASNFNYTIGPYLGSDHLPVIIQLNVAPNRTQSRAPKWVFDDSKWTSWNNDLSSHLKKADIKKISNPANAYHTFYNCLMLATQQNFRLASPNPSAQQEPGRPWFNEEAEKVVQEARAAFNSWSNNPLCTSARIAWKKAEAVKKRTLRRLKKGSWETFASNLDPRGANPKVWQFIKSMNGKGSDPPIGGTDIEKDGGFATQPVEKAAIFLDQFDVSGHLGPAHISIDKSTREAMASQATCPLNRPALINEINDCLDHLKDTAMGADLVNNKMLRNLNSNNRELLVHVFNRIRATGYVPKSWKEAVVIPLNKPGKPRSKRCSYRPISLTSCLCKAYERWLNTRLTWLLESKNLLPRTQSGFRKGRSTLDNIVALEQRIRKGWSELKKTYAVFLDMKKAFDMVWIPGLLKKLASIGISGPTLIWLKNFLTGRSFRVRIGNTLSDAKKLFAGVPQGSILSPLLFNVMLIDFPEADDQVQALLYADDIEVDVAAESKEEARRLLQKYLNKVEDWARQWRFEFSVEKSVMVVFTRDAASHPPALQLMNRPIPAAESIKFLGLHFDRKLIWKDHIQRVIGKIIKANNAISTIARRHYGPSIKALVCLYKALIRSQADYGLVVYGTAAKTHIDKLDAALRVSLRTILGAKKSTPTEILYSELGIEPIQLRRELLTATYTLRLGRKPSNAAYASARLTTRNTAALTATHTPCLFSAVQRARQIDSRAFSRPASASPVHAWHSSPPPWQSPLIRTYWFPGTKKDATLNPTAAQQQVKSLLAALPTGSITVYTDGSRSEEHDVAASAFFIPSLSVERTFQLHAGANILTAEVYAINKAVQFFYNTQPPSSEQEIFILADSQAAIKSLVSAAAEKEDTVLQTLHSVLRLKSRGIKTNLVWIPSHVGIEGNDKADSLAASECLTPTNKVTDSFLSVSEAITKFKQTWTEERRQFLHQYGKPIVQLHTKPSIAEWLFYKSRSISVALHRLRSGHNNLNAFKHRIDIDEDPFCRFGCEAIENANHVILHCSEFADDRVKISEFCQKKNMDFA